MSDKRIEIVEATDAEKYRLWQAEQLLREAGYEPDEDGNWHPVEEEEVI